jgi:hypothetical protein
VVKLKSNYIAVNHDLAIGCGGLNVILSGAVMRLLGFAVLAIASCTLAGRPAHAAGPGSGVVLGDSQGQGVAQASGLKNLARISVHIRGPKAVQQINSAPMGATAFVVLGSNDAEGSIKGLDTSIDAIVQAAAKRDIKLVWLGPPCVRKSWNARVRELDQMLQRRFAQGSVKYVSMWDDKICSGVFHEPDGVHLTMKGYAYMWEKARTAAGFALAAADAGVRPAEAAGANEAAPKAGPRSAAKSANRPRKKHVRSAAFHARATPPVPLSHQQGGN